MRRTPKLALIGAAALALPLLSTPAVAQHYDGGLEVTCKQENFRVRAYDGAGHLIVDHGYSNGLGSYSAGLGTVAFDTAPTANPITVYVISEAGNGLAEESQTIGTGTCDKIRPPLTLDPSATTEPPTTEAPETTTTLDDGTTTVVPTPTTASPALFTASPSTATAPVARCATTCGAGTPASLSVIAVFT